MLQAPKNMDIPKQILFLKLKQELINHWTRNNTPQVEVYKQTSNLPKEDEKQSTNPKMKSNHHLSMFTYWLRSIQEAFGSSKPLSLF